MELSQRELLALIDSLELRIEGLEYDIENNRGDVALKEELDGLYYRLKKEMGCLWI